MKLRTEKRTFQKVVKTYVRPVAGDPVVYQHDLTNGRWWLSVDDVLHNLAQEHGPVELTLRWGPDGEIGRFVLIKPRKSEIDLKPSEHISKPKATQTTSRPSKRAYKRS